MHALRSLGLKNLTGLVFLTSMLAQAQTSLSTIRGVIRDQTDAPIPGATITVMGLQHFTATTESAADGSYSVRDLTTGAYTLQVVAPGFAQGHPIHLDVHGNRVTVNVVMRLAVRSESVTVNEELASVLAVDSASNANATIISQQSLHAVSDDPDDFESDIRALAGPSAGLKPAHIYIDGQTVDDQVLPSKSSISEIHLNQNPFAPEFDEMGMGRIEIITKSGADKYSGEGFFNYGNDTFNSRNPYASAKPPFDLKQYGGSLGGPLGKRLSFFFDIDRRNIGNGAVINAVTLDPATLATIDPYTQAFVSPFERLRVSPRIDYRFNTRHSLTVRYGLTKNDYDHYGVGNFNLVSQGADAHLTEHSLQIEETSILGANIVNQTQFLFLHQHHTHQATDAEPTIQVLNAFNGGGDPITFSSYIHHHYQVQNYTTISHHSHTWRFGVRLRAVSMADVSQENFLGTYMFGGAYAPILNANNMSLVPGISCNPNTPSAGCTTISSIEQYRRTLLLQQTGFTAAQIRALGGGATQFTLNAGQPQEFAGDVDAGLFVGDDWRIRSNLTVSLGLRFETQTNIHDRADFAPRVGFAWSPGNARSPKLVLRGGFGIFYERFDGLDLVTAQRYNGIDQKQYLILYPDFFPSVPSPAMLAYSAQNQTTQTISSSLHAPYLLQSMFSVERQLPKKTTVALTYANAHGVHQFRSRDINAPLPGTYTGASGSGVFPYPDQGPIYEMESSGLFNQNQVILNVNTHLSKNVSLFGSYALNYARSNTDGIDTFPANQYNLAGEYGPAMNDIRHRGTLGGSITAKWGVELSPLIVLQSGAPFNITTSQNIYGDGLATARPAFATDPNAPGVISTPYGFLDPNPSPSETIIPRNFGRSPGQFVVNLRVGKTFAFGDDAGGSGSRRANHRYTLTAAVSARNVLNHVNPGPTIGDVNSPLFGKSNQIAAGIGAFDNSANNRRLEFQLRLGF